MRRGKALPILDSDWLSESLGHVIVSYLLSEFWLSFLDGGHDEISGTGGRKTVQSTFDALELLEKRKGGTKLTATAMT